MLIGVLSVAAVWPATAQAATRSRNRSGPRETTSWALPSPAITKPSRSGCSQQNQRSSASREANATALGSSIRAGTVTLTSRRLSPTSASRSTSEASADAAVAESIMGREERPYCSGRERVMATSPVRAISIRPWGRIMRSKASIFSFDPVTSMVIVRRETSTIFALKMSAN